MNNKTKLIGIIGLLGSGKTSLAKQMRKEEGMPYFDEFIGNAGSFVLSKDYKKMIETLKRGNSCCIIEISLCHQSRRSELENNIERDAHGTNVEYIWFEDNPTQCEKNIISAGEDVDGKLMVLSKMAEIYDVPDGIKARKVYGS